jgi:hypothetical protein
MRTVLLCGAIQRVASYARAQFLPLWEPADPARSVEVCAAFSDPESRSALPDGPLELRSPGRLRSGLRSPYWQSQLPSTFEARALIPKLSTFSARVLVPKLSTFGASARTKTIHLWRERAYQICPPLEPQALVPKLSTFSASARTKTVHL